jgi:hypothetical protein
VAIGLAVSKTFPLNFEEMTIEESAGTYFFNRIKSIGKHVREGYLSGMCVIVHFFGA